MISFFAGHAAADVAFVLDDTAPAFSDGLNNGDVVSAGGIDLTFSNVVVADGSAFGDVEGVGILISGTTGPGLTDVISFDFSFNQHVQMLTYDIGTHESVPTNSFFTVTGFNGTSGNNLIPEGTSFTESTFGFDAGSIPIFEAGQVYSFTHNLTSAGDPLFNLEELYVRQVPEPASGSLLFACGLIGVMIRRRTR